MLSYIPDMEAGELPEKDFLYGILATLYEEETNKLICKSRDSRAITKESMQDEMIAIDSEILRELEKISSLKSMKSYYYFNNYL